MKTTLTTICTFSELSEEQQKEYYEANRERFEPDYWWYETTIDNEKEILKALGFYDVEIHFSGFWSQGDGAQFLGNWSYDKGLIKRIRDEYPECKAVQDLAEVLAEVAKECFYQNTFSINSFGHNYSHEMATSFDFPYFYVGDNLRDMTEDQLIRVKEACRDYMRDIYKTLEKEYNYLSSWESVKDCPEAFDYIEITLDEKVVA